jgi:ubiquinone/menaquinone biosynthesis C-methylase UbiE
LEETTSERKPRSKRIAKDGGLAMNAVDAATQSEIKIQRAYYADTAARYDSMHVHQDDEHSFALRFMISMIEPLGIESILDVGCGTGRGLLTLQKARPEIKAVGVEPSAELRGVGCANGLTETQLIDGDAMSLAFADGSFDLACEFGALHHIPDPAKAVSEMLRVARKAIFISDCNNFGQGSKLARLFKQSVNAVGLWPMADFIKTRGKGYAISEGDGLFYSYSVFNNYKQIRRACQAVHVLTTADSGPNPYRTSSHVALLGIKPQSKAD